MYKKKNSGVFGFGGGVTSGVCGVGGIVFGGILGETIVGGVGVGVGT